METIEYLYNAGLSTRDIASYVGCNASTVLRRLKRLGIRIRSRSASVSLARSKKNWSQYTLQLPDLLNQSSSYWLGFLLGDGCVQLSSRSGDCVRLDLQAKDIKHLEKFRCWLGSDHPIVYRAETNSYSIRIVSKRLVAMLINYGIVPNKSKIAIVDVRLKDSPHFWRGLVDADGWLGQERGAIIGLTGTKEICNSFIEFVGGTQAKPVRKTKYCYSVMFTAKIATRAIQKIYGINGTRLERKGATAAEILSFC